ncbi:protein kinase [Streptomyces sp. NPDC059853]|uniref:protein kinase domain-containing protein n=1 Tax=Streptomyces sp. NPDC059853 TaxID=3346973 RepID=UPI00364A0D2B
MWPTRAETVRLTAGGPQRAWDLDAPAALTAGRDADCEIRAPADDRRVSRHHCVFTADPPAITVRDLGSRNGTYVNGARIDSAVRLADGDEVRIGGMTVHVFVSGGLIGDYLVVRELGRGAQGVVYLARHRDSGGEVALKVLRGVRPESVHGFLREIRTCRGLSHPHLVGFKGAGADGKRFFLASEYCDGGSLAQWEGSTDAGEAVRIIGEALEGLDHMHTGTAEPLVHRDLSPRNILLTGPQSTAKIADFGLAKAYERAGLSGYTDTGALGGGVEFMPRSQVVNYKYATPPVDVWAAAACLYWLLTRATPRDFPPGTDPVAVVLREPAAPIRERASGLPPRLAKLIDTVLADEDPRPERAMSAREFGRALKEAL